MTDVRQTAIEAAARAMCEWDGLDWDEARAELSGPDGETTASAYWYAAEAALDALLAPRRVTCETHQAEKQWGWGPGGKPDDWECPDCNGSGTVPAEPLAVLSADLPKYEQVGDWVYDPDHHMAGQLIHRHAETCDGDDDFPPCRPVFVRVPTPSEEDK